MRRSIMFVSHVGAFVSHVGAAIAVPLAMVAMPDALHAQAPVVGIYVGQTGTSSTGTIRESGTNVSLGPEGSFRVSVASGRKDPITIKYVVSGTATPGTDYAALSGTLVIPASPTAVAVVIPVNVLNDGLTERDEVVGVRLVASSAYTIDANHVNASLTIIDIDQKLQFTVVDAQAAEPGDNRATVKVDRLGTLQGDLKLPLVLGGTASNGSDFVALPDTLVIPSGQGSVTFDIVPLADAAAEGSETVLISTRGYAFLPGGGVTITIADAAATIATSLSSVIEVQGNSANFVITRSGDPTRATAVAYTISGTATNGVDFNTIPSTVTIAAGASSASIAIVVRSDNVQEGAETIVLTITSGAALAAGSPNSATLVINDNVAPTVATMALTPASLVGGSTSTALITLNGPAPSGGLAIALSSNTPSATLASTVLSVPQGQSTATFAITTSPVSANVSAAITAAAPTGTTISQSLQVLAPVLTVFALNRNAVTPQSASDGSSVTGSVTLSGPAPAGGTQVTLASNTPASASVPATVTVPSNQSSATFPVTVVPVSTSSAVTITATRASQSFSQTLQVRAPTFATFTMSPSSLAGRTAGVQATTTGNFTLDGPVPAAGVSLSASSNNAKLSVSPASTFLTAGTTAGQVVATAQPVDASTVVAVTLTTPNSSSASNVTIVPGAPLSLALSPASVVGGSSTTATLQMTGNAPSTGLTLPVISSSPAVFLCGSGPPTTISVPANFISTTFGICTQTVTGNTSATVTVGQGASAVSAVLQLTANAIVASSVVLSTGNTSGGSALTGTVSLPQAAPAGGTPVTLLSSGASVVFRNANGTIVSPLSVTVPAGQSSAGFQLQTFAVATDQTVIVSASPGSASQSLIVRAPTLTAVGVPDNQAGGIIRDTTTIVGGSSRVITVRISSEAPASGIPVQLSSNNALVTVPSIVTILAGQSSTTFTASTGSTQVDVNAVITATLAGLQRTLQVRVAGPISPTALVVAPTQIPAGSTATGTVTINSAAPAGGTTVPLSSNNVKAVVPASVVVATGQTSASFPITTTPFGSNSSQSAQISTTLGGTTRSANLLMDAFRVISINVASNVLGGATVAVTVHLNQVAPSSGIVVALSSSNAAFPVPSSLTIPAGAAFATFSVTSVPVASFVSVSIGASFEQSAITAPVSVMPPSLSSLTLNSNSVVGGGTVIATIGLQGNAPVGGLVIAITASPGGSATVPATVTVPAGTNGVSFTIGTQAVAVATTVTITANSGGINRPQPLTITP